MRSNETNVRESIDVEESNARLRSFELNVAEEKLRVRVVVGDE